MTCTRERRRRTARLTALPVGYTSRVSGALEFDPGVSQHEWAARWEALEPDLADEPENALAEAAGLLQEMARELEVGTDAELDDWVRDLGEVRETARRLSEGDPVPADEQAEAADMARSLYAEMIDNRRTWGGVTGTEPL